MKDFIMREISTDIELKHNERIYGTIKATRTRTSNGHKSIKLILSLSGQQEQYLTFSSEILGDFYEQSAQIAAQALEEIIENKCELPKI